MSDMLAFFESIKKMVGTNHYNDFMLTYGREYKTGPNTYAGPRLKPHNCFGNALHLTMIDSSLTYVEGKVFVYGVPLDHAWCISVDGIVIDPTITDTDKEYAYFGVALKTDYVAKAVLLNKVYGVLDFFYARKTVPKLFELGLEAGQQWLLDQKTSKELTKYRREKEKSNETVTCV